jgi:hypothetical protein
LTGILNCAFRKKSNCSGSHQVTKTQRIDLFAIALAQARRAGMNFTPLILVPVRP